jgi:hypothetical protein
MDTDAWRSLRPADRCVLIEIMRRYDGKNNGLIGLGVREAAELCRINKDTAAQSFRKLGERGFIECGQEGSFDYKARHAAEWRLTWLKCDRTGALPSRAFLKWVPADTQAAKSKSRSETKGQSVRKRGTDGQLASQPVPYSRTKLRAIG